MNKKTLLTAENAQSETPGKNKLVLNKRTIVKFSEKKMRNEFHFLPLVYDISF